MSRGSEYDVIVVGGGPGGSSAASFCSRAGLKTLLLEKSRFPRDKTCGDAISGKSIAVLRELGLHTWIEKEPHARAMGVVFSSPRGDVVEIPFPKRIDPDSMKDQRQHRYIDPGYVCRREVFDNIVFQYAKKQEHVTTIEEFQATDVILENGAACGVTGKHKNGGKTETFRAKVVIGADGALSKVAEKVGAYDFLNKNHDHWIGAFRIYYDGISDLTENIEIHFIQDLLPGYFWIFPLENGWANVGAGMIETDLQRRDGNGQKVNMRKITYDVIANHPMFRERFRNAKEIDGSFSGWLLPCGSERRKLAGNGWMLVGDSAGLIDPFSGEGIGNALVSGRFAAEQAATAIRGGDTSETALRPYESRVFAELGHELDMSYKLQQMGRRTWLLNWVLRKAATKPKVQAAISDMLADREKKEQLTGWWGLLKILLF